MAKKHRSLKASQPQQLAQAGQDQIEAAQRRFSNALDYALDRARQEMHKPAWVGRDEAYLLRQDAFLHMLDRRIRDEFGTLLRVAPQGAEPAKWAEWAAQRIVSRKLRDRLRDPDTVSLLAQLLGVSAAEVMTDLRRWLGELIQGLYDDEILEQAASPLAAPVSLPPQSDPSPLTQPQAPDESREVTGRPVIETVQAVESAQEAVLGQTLTRPTVPTPHQLVAAYKAEVLEKKGIELTDEDIWRSAKYTDQTEYYRWLRQDAKHPNPAADRNFRRLLTEEKPHLK